MQKLTEVLAMHGHGVYVWPSFAVAAVFMLALSLFSLRALRRASRTLDAVRESRPQP